MKKIIGLVGVGAIALLAMSSTCSTGAEAAIGSDIKTTKEMKAVPPAGGAGIEFKKMSFAKAMKEAQKTGKLIFIDAYTDWCGPCKRMAATSFKDKSVGELYNKNFINLKIEMEKSEDGPEIARKYGVRAYPTLIIVDGSGRMVKQTIGMKSKDQLIAFAKSAM
jgi:thiol-disulfide isomerase/thioredoxin